MSTYLAGLVQTKHAMCGITLHNEPYYG